MTQIKNGINKNQGAKLNERGKYIYSKFYLKSHGKFDFKTIIKDTEELNN